MIKNECYIVKDILPLYAEQMVSPETGEFVKEHLDGCEKCRREYENLKSAVSAPPSFEAGPIKDIKRKLTMKRVRTAILAALLTLTLALSVFAFLSSPVYFPYSEKLLAVQTTDEGILITFDKDVTGFEIENYTEPDENEKTVTQITAWTSLWDKIIRKNNGELSTAISLDNSVRNTVLYCANDGKESVRVFGEDLGEGVVSLPRLALGYYIFLAGAAFVICAVLWIVVRKKTSVRKWVERIALYPLSYVLSSLIVLGVSTSTYSIIRDFFLIVIISVLLYTCFLIAHGIIYLKKEIKDLSV